MQIKIFCSLHFFQTTFHSTWPSASVYAASQLLKRITTVTKHKKVYLIFIPKIKLYEAQITIVESTIAIGQQEFSSSEGVVFKCS